MKLNREEVLGYARETLDIEIEGIRAVSDALGDDFLALVEKTGEILDRGGKIVVTGLGKSGHVGKKMAATLASTGSTAIFMHPVEAMHGDLGMIQEGDLLLALSYSGESDELVRVILPAKRLGVTIASFSGNPKSQLASLSDIHVCMKVPREACPFNLAPTTSSTATLALGDALAMTMMHLRKFTRDNYGRLHPSGAIGRAVTMRVSDTMRKGERLPLVSTDVSVRDALLKMTECRSGSAVIVAPDGTLAGIFTDGDFRRRINDPELLDKKISSVMIARPISIRSDALAVEVLKLVEKHKIDDVVVTDAENHPVGLVDVQDLPGLKLM